MTLPDFELHLPTRLDEALALLRDGGDRAEAMAGGTDLTILMSRGARSPDRVVVLTGIPELRGVRLEDGAIRIGACTTIAQLESDPVLARHAPALVDAARRMATPQIRSIATVAGNLATAAACGDVAPVLAALDGRLRLRSGSSGRVLSIEDFLTGVRATALGTGELVTTIEVPTTEPGSGSGYVKFGYRQGAQVAVVSAAAAVRRAEGKVRALRLVLGAVAPVPLVVRGASALVGHRMEGPPLDAACAAAGVECAPISDLRGSETYRRVMASVIARRALLLAWTRSAES